MSIKHEDLSSVFAPTATKGEPEGTQRGKKLAGLLPPRGVKSPAHQVPETTSQPLQPTQPPVIEGKGPVSSEAAVSGIKSKGVYLPHDLLKVLKARTRGEMSTYTDMLIDAFDAISDKELIEKISPQASSTGLAGGMPRRRRTTDSAKSGTQIQLRLDKAQDDWLTAKEKTVGAPSRSALVTMAYEMYFEATPPKRRNH
ncbi:hypothetical protein [Arthrobacter glacialis]|uniref:Uncharacterized protein n=1 Tax=Arthrobacter glacialis TaxID=1664 RepID=A0A2S3ZUK6_ARTGL|nr:hypothetical protein [Arthrobacter glacialis]POH72537.1 hypothetical protein CVS27_15565 [Arthrobacter glacialis]